jgi:short-subunit dehydrogenase
MDIGLAVLAAGFCISGPFADAPLGPQLEMVCLNVTAVTRLAHTFARRLVNRGRGGIMLFGSILGRQGVPWVSTYAATKAYGEILAEGLHNELAPRGIDVLSVVPGPVHTGFAARAGLEYGSATRPELVADAAVKALGRRTTVVPGVRARALTTMLALLPRRLRIRFLGDVMKGMRTAAPSTARAAE